MALEYSTMQLIGVSLFIFIVLLVLVPLVVYATGFAGNTFCSSSVQLRSWFNDLFFGGFGRFLINDEIFDALPLLCRTDVKTYEKGGDAEKALADSVLDCYNRFGAGKLNGVFPHSSALCSVIIFNPINSSDYVNFTRAYELMTNSSKVNSSVYDYDTSEWDLANPFRFCLEPFYHSNIYANSFGSWNYGDGSQTASLDDDYYKLNEHENLNGCFSMKEMLLNGYRGNMRTPSTFSGNDVCGLGDLKLFCKDMARRRCGEISSNYSDYKLCTSSLFRMCNYLKWKGTMFYKCTTWSIANPIPNGKYDHEFYRSNISYLTYYDNDFVSYLQNRTAQPFGVGNDTAFRRGMFYIRFFDYSDWLQQALDPTWYYFGECGNDIVIGHKFWKSVSPLSKDISQKHDYVAVCYKPFIDYQFLYGNEFPESKGGVVVVG